MQKFFKFVPAALALVALASCSEADLFNESTTVEKVKDGLTVQVEELTGDVTRQANATYNGHAVIWQEGDQINVYDNKLTMYDEYQYDADANPARFIGVNASGTTNITSTQYALFPANQVDYAGWSSKGTKVVMRIPQLIIFDEESEVGSGVNYAYVSNLPMWGDAEGTYPDAEVSLKYLTGVLRVNMQNVFAEKATFLKIESQDDQPISGAFQAQLSDENGTVIEDAKLEGGTAALSTANAIYVDLRNVPSYMTNLYIPIIARQYDYLKVGVTKMVATEASPLMTNEEQIVGDLDALTWTEDQTTGWETLRNWDAGVTFNRAKMKSITEEAQFNLDGVTTCEMLTETFKQYANYEIGQATIADVLELTIGGVNGLAVTRTGNENYKDDYTVYVPETEVDKIIVHIPAGIKSGAATVDLQIVDADIKKPFTGELVIDVEAAGITSNDLNSIIVNLPGAKFRLAGNLTAGQALGALNIKNVDELYIGDGTTATVLTTTNGTTVNTAKKLTITNAATVTDALDLVQTKDMAQVNVNAGGTLNGKLEVLKAEVNVDGTVAGNAFVYGSAGTVNIGGAAGTMANLATIGNVTIANTAENDAISGYLSALGNNVITLKQGYVRAIKYDQTVGEFADNAGTGKYGKSSAGNYGKYYVKTLAQLTKSDKRAKLVTIKLDEIVGNGLTAIASIDANLLEYDDGTDVWNFAQLTESKWGGYAIAAGFKTNYSSAAANDKIYTASELATIDANAATGGTYYLYNNFDLDNKTWTCPAITVNFDGRDPRLASADEHAERIDEVLVAGFSGKVHYIKNVKFAPAADAANTGLFASITAAAAVTIQNVNIETVATTTTGSNSKIGTIAGKADASTANITFTNLWVKDAALGGTTYTGTTPTFVGVREVGGLVGNATTAAGNTIAFTANKVEETSISGQGYLGGIVGAAIGAGTVDIQGNNISLTSFTNAPQPANYDMVNKNYGTIGMAIGQVDQPETGAADGTAVTVGTTTVNTFNDVISGNRVTLGFPYNFVVGQYTASKMAFVAGDELKYAFYGGDVLFGYSPNSATKIQVKDAKSPAGASTTLTHDATKWVAADKTNFDGISNQYKLNSYIQWTPYIDADPAF